MLDSRSQMVARALCRSAGSLLAPRFCVPSGIDRLSASTSLPTVEKIGPPSEASAAASVLSLNQSFSSTATRDLARPLGPLVDAQWKRRTRRVVL